MKTNEPIAMKTMINTNGSNGSESKMAVQSGPIVLDTQQDRHQNRNQSPKDELPILHAKKYNAEKRTVQG
jgi:hypothetical protein